MPVNRQKEGGKMTKKNAELVRYVLARGGKVGELVAWLGANLRKHEDLDVHCWIGQLWYVMVGDTVRGTYPNEFRCWFTVDVVADEIAWNCDTKHTACGGNCGVRDRRWLRLCRERFPAQMQYNSETKQPNCNESRRQNRWMHEYKLTPLWRPRRKTPAVYEPVPGTPRG